MTRPRHKAHRGGRAIANKRNQTIVTWGTTCHLCHHPIPLQLRYPHPLSFSVDHYVPLSQGGPDTLSNWRPSHLGCNVKRQDRPTSVIKTMPAPRLRRPPESGASFFR